MGEHVKITGVSKEFGSYRALRDISLTINRGEFIVLLGPSGCGKSTLLRMIAGLETISSGTISISGKELNHVHPRDRNIAMVFQNYALYPHMTVAKNLAYPLKLARKPKAEIAASVEKVAKMMELDALLERKPSELSGGQRQRVAMGRALVRNPDVFLMDEPLSNLDARLRQQMRVDIRHLQQKLGVTTIYVTHDQIEAMTMADRIVVMNQGVIDQVGTADEIYNHPNSRYVASFIGSPPMNFIEDGTLVTQLAASHLDAANVAIGIRPELLDLKRRSDDDVALSGVCITTEVLGSETLCHVELAQSASSKVRVIAKLQGNQSNLAGKMLSLFFRRGAENYFDLNTGERRRA